MGNYCCKYSVQTEQKTELTPMTYNETASGIPTNMNSAQMNHLTVNKTTEEGEPLSTANKTEPQGEGLQKKLKVRSKARAGRNENHNNEKGGNEVEEKGKEDYFSEHDDLESGGDDWDFKLVRHLHLIMAVDSSASMKGNRWTKLVKAYRLILNRLSKGFGNKVSVVNLGQNIAKNPIQMIAPNGALMTKLEFLGGGTKFKPGIQLINKLIKLTPHDMGIIIFFFSDGADINPKEDMLEMSRLKKKFAQFQFYSIGVEATVSMMILMAKEVEGKFVKVAKAELLSMKLSQMLFDTYSEFESFHDQD